MKTREFASMDSERIKRIADFLEKLAVAGLALAITNLPHQSIPYRR